MEEGLPHSKSLHLFAIVRIDKPIDMDNPENNLAVVKTFTTKLLAEQEAVRLNEVNRDKACCYVVFTTRLIA